MRSQPLKDPQSNSDNNVCGRVIAGTIIWSDEWAAYCKLSSLGYIHQTVNFQDPEANVCTNHVEAYWNAVKRRFNKMFGTAKSMIPVYLDQHTWREHHGCTGHMAQLSLQ